MLAHNLSRLRSTSDDSSAQGRGLSSATTVYLQTPPQTVLPKPEHRPNCRCPVNNYRVVVGKSLSRREWEWDNRVYISRQIGLFHTQTAFSYAKVHGPRTETRQDPTQTHQGTWSGVAVLWGLSKKRESARMGANGADGADGPDGADGANRRRPAPTDADSHRRRTTTRKHPHTPTVGEAQSSAMSGGLVGCCGKHGSAQIRREERAASRSRSNRSS